MNEVINKNIPFPYTQVGRYEEANGLAEKHETLFRIMVAFDAFCREYGIQYSLADGTLLGALRHGDFIPWDDDADVMLTRSEYIKLRQAVAQSSKIRLLKIHFLDRITIDRCIGQKEYLDLFINEDMPAGKIAFWWKKNMTRFLRCSFLDESLRNFRLEKQSRIKKGLRKAFGKSLYLAARVFVGKRDVFELNDQIVQIGKLKQSNIYTRFTSRMYETNRRFSKPSYEAGYGEVQFRGHRFMALQNAVTFLHEMYGDFETMPVESKRVPVHTVNMMESVSSCVKWYN